MKNSTSSGTIYSIVIAVAAGFLAGHIITRNVDQPPRPLVSERCSRSAVADQYIDARSGNDGIPVFLVTKSCFGSAHLVLNDSVVAEIEFYNGGVIIDNGTMRVGIK